MQTLPIKKLKSIQLPYPSQMPGKVRFISGFVLGIFIMLMVTHVLVVNHTDFDKMQRGVRMLLSGSNPWSPTTWLEGYYNPPFGILFMWPMLFVTAKISIITGGAFLLGLVFYWKAWTALAWFGTNTFLFLISAGSIDMYLMGAGMTCLVASDQISNKFLTILLRVMGYGFLMVKFQGGLFIVCLYILMRRDWKGLLISVFLYGVLFSPLIPSWLNVILTDPPLSQTEASHSLWAKFGLLPALPIAVLVLFARRWKYWQIGGALAGILTPYGMVGLPIFLTMTAVKKWAAIPAYILFAGFLAWLTWIWPINQQLMATYHLSMLGLAMILACLIPAEEPIDQDTISAGDWIRRKVHLAREKAIFKQT